MRCRPCKVHHHRVQWVVPFFTWTSHEEYDRPINGHCNEHKVRHERLATTCLLSTYVSLDVLYFTGGVALHELDRCIVPRMSFQTGPIPIDTSIRGRWKKEPCSCPPVFDNPLLWFPYYNPLGESGRGDSLMQGLRRRAVSFGA